MAHEEKLKLVTDFDCWWMNECFLNNMKRLENSNITDNLTPFTFGDDSVVVTSLNFSKHSTLSFFPLFYGSEYLDI